MDKITTFEIREYAESEPVEFYENDKGRLVVGATNEGGYNGTEVDLLELLHFVHNNMPEIWQQVSENRPKMAD
jgi:hypothetical protein